MKGCFVRKSTTLPAFAADFRLPLSHQELMVLAAGAWSEYSADERTPRTVSVDGRTTYKMRPRDVMHLCLFLSNRDNALSDTDSRSPRFRLCQLNMRGAAIEYVADLGADALDMGITLPDDGDNLITSLLNGIVREAHAARSSSKTVH